MIEKKGRRKYREPAGVFGGSMNSAIRFVASMQAVGALVIDAYFMDHSMNGCGLERADDRGDCLHVSQSHHHCDHGSTTERCSI